MTNNIGYNSLDTDLFKLFYQLIYFGLFKAVQQYYHSVYENDIKINYIYVIT